MKVKFLDGSEKEIANLRGANLQDANLQDANLQDANLQGANLQGANLWGANLRGANLRGADLWGANLRGADLWGANLQDADLRGANLQDANLWGANLRGTNLQGANLRGANLQGANLQGANLQGAKFLETFVIVAKGVLIGYKKLANGNIAKVRIPQAAARVNAYGSRKCRAAYVTVISGTGVSKHDGVTKYAPKLKVVADQFDPDPRVECSGGIHFFLTEQEAKDY